ncbi:MAG: AlpA family phage regulatory protein [Xanthomonadales bacterium]|nr:AlpA family phage regulatory protein [Xanthomonadales bacterium]
MSSRKFVKPRVGPSPPVSPAKLNESARPVSIGLRDRVLRRPEVERITGLSRSSIYRGMANDDFPRAITISKKSVGWLASSIEAWLAARVAASGAPQE